MTPPVPDDPGSPTLLLQDPLIESARRLLLDPRNADPAKLADVLDRLERRLDDALIRGLAPRR